MTYHFILISLFCAVFGLTSVFRGHPEVFWPCLLLSSLWFIGAVILWEIRHAKR